MADVTHTVGIRLGADGKPLIEASKQAAAAQAGLAEQFRNTADSAKKSADESQRFVARLKEEAETLGRSRAEIERYRAGQLQLTDAQKKSVDASTAQIAAHDRAQQALAFVARAAALATTALVAYGAVTVAGVKGAIDQAAALHNLSQTYGISTQMLSAYQYQTRLAGVSQDEFSLGVKMLSKNISEARGGVGDGAALFRLLGRDIEGAVKSGASIEQLLPMIADKFASFADGPNKAALALALLGRSGELLIPWLNKGAAGFTEAAREAEAFGRVVGPDFARRADEFNANLVRMNMLLGMSKVALAEQLLPELDRVIKRFIDGARESGIFTGALEAMREAASQAMQPSEKELRARLARTDALILGLERQGSGPGDQSVIGENYRSLLALRQSLQAQLQVAGMDREARRVTAWQQNYDEYQRTLRARQAPALPKTGGGPTDYQRLMSEAQVMVQVAAQEANAVDKVTEAERALIQIQAARAQGMLKDLKPAQLAEVQGWLETAKALQEQNAARQRDLELNKAQVQSLDELLKREEVQGQLLANLNQKWSENTQQIELETELFGRDAERQKVLAAFTGTRLDQIRLEAQLTAEGNADREKANAFRAIDLELQKAMIDAAPEEIDTLYRLADARKAAIGQAIDSKAAAQASAAVNQAIRSDFKQTSDNIQRSLTDALMRGFERGKGFAQNFRDTLVNMFKTLVLEPMLRPILAPVAGALTGLSTSLFGGGTAGAASGLGMASNAYSLANLFRGGSFGQTFADFGNFFGSIGATTETGATFGLLDALGGFAAANPLTAIGLAVGGAGLLGGLFGGDSGPAQRALQYSAPFGSTNRAFDNYPNYPWQTQWGSADMGPAQTAFQTQMAAEEQALIQRLALSPEQMAKVNTALTGPNAQWFAAGMEGTDVAQSGVFEKIQAARLQAIASALGDSIQELTHTLSVSDKEWIAATDKIRESLQSGLDPLGYWTAKAEALRTELGASATTLDEWRGQFLGVLDGLSQDKAARWQELGQALDQAAQARDRQLEVEEQARAQAERAAEEVRQAAEQAAEEQRRAAEQRRTIQESLQSGLDPLGYWSQTAQALRAELGSSAVTLDDWRKEFLGVLDGLSDDQIARWQSLGDALDQAAQARDRQLAIEQQARDEAARAAQEAARAADERARSIAGLRGSLSQRESSLGGAVAALPGQLGISSLQDFQRSLAISESVAPLDRLSAARGYYADTLARARADDLGAVLSFQSSAQDLLTIGRDVYASGGGFQSIFADVRAATTELIQRQSALQLDIVQSVPISIREAANDQIAELKRGFAAMVDELQGVRAELRRLEAA